MKMNSETWMLMGIGLSFLGFMTGLVGKNIRNHQKRTFKSEGFYTYLTAVSVIVMVVLAFLYTILFN